MPNFQQITPHIFKLNLRWLGIPIGVWLVEDHGEWTLVDAGAKSNGPAIVAAVKAKLVDTIPARVVITHGHRDHVGGLQAVIDAFDCPVWAHPKERPFLMGDMIYQQIRWSWWGYRIGSYLVADRWRYPVAKEIEEGDTVAGCKVLHVPGHTPGHIALWHQEDRAVICGDVYVHLLIARLAGTISFFTPDLAASQRSMEKLAALDVDYILPSHGPPYHR